MPGNGKREAFTLDDLRAAGRPAFLRRGQGDAIIAQVVAAGPSTPTPPGWTRLGATPTEPSIGWRWRAEGHSASVIDVELGRSGAPRVQKRRFHGHLHPLRG